jgi:branched-chain amino acid aminotransferase
MNIKYELKPADQRRSTPFYPEQLLGFGQQRTDHMFLIDFNGEEWVNPRITAYGPLAIAPGAVTLHYAQEVFEGGKAFLHEDGELYAFRIEMNAERLNTSCEIMCMPTIDVNIQVEAILKLLDIERLWYPHGQEGASMYIRPFMFGTSDSLGVKPSTQFTYCVFLSPSGPYYPEGFNPVKLLISEKFHRAAQGGSGAAKAGGNYAASLRAGKFAKEKGASQVLYLDSTNTYLEEAGAMNHYHVTKDNKVVIPEFTDTILKSITSRSMLELTDYFDFDVVQERIPVSDFIEGVKSGYITEAGGFGTAAVVSPVGTYLLESGEEIHVNGGKVGPVSQKMYDTLTGFQRGTIKAPEGWLTKVERHSN